MIIQVDASGNSINKYGEELCGDRVEIIRGKTGVTAILADGIGVGARANIMVSLAVKMMSTMLGRGEPIEDIADMIVESQSAGIEEGTNYSHFTLIQVTFSGTIFIVQMETPDLILLHRGKTVCIEVHKKMKLGKIIRIGVSHYRQTDTIIAVNKGVLNAGSERNLKVGWQLESISTFMKNAYNPRISAEELVRLLLAASSSLSYEKPKDDLSALVFKVSR